MSRELSIDAALAQLSAQLRQVTQTESVPLHSAAQRVLARDVVAPIDLPSFDNAAMDGYALRAGDSTQALHVIGHALAGHAFSGAVDAGSCVRIMTGARVPSGADTVIPWEDTENNDDRVTLKREINARSAGANIRRRGEHIARGAVALPAHRTLHAADIGLAAALGLASLDVFRTLRVALLSTGDELIDAGNIAADNRQFDANRPMLLSLLTQAGFATQDLGICADNADALAAHIERAFDHSADVVLTSGGAAQGDADVMRRLGDMQFVPLNIRPGRGLLIGQLERAQRRFVVIGLPGNAVAAFVIYQLIARPLLRFLAGAAHATAPLHMPLPLACDVRVRGGRIDYQRARIVCANDGSVQLAPLQDQGSAMLCTVTEADALIALGPESVYTAGTPVPAVLLDHIR